MRNMIQLDKNIVSEINAIAKYANRDVVNIEVLSLMVYELSVNLVGQKPCTDCEGKADEKRKNV